MAITDPRAVNFANTRVRPLCEAVRALVAEIGSANTEWSAGINALFPNDTTVLTDNRTAEGVSILTGADVQSAVGILIAVAAASNTQIIGKPCVRALTVS